MAHQLSPMEKPDKILKLDGISAESVEAHWGLYEGYVKKYNEIQERLDGADAAAANQIFSDYRSYRSAITFAIGGIKNHELYFGNLGNGGGSPDDALGGRLEQHFGGVDAFLSQLRAAGMAARGWAWLAYDWDWDRLDVHIGDAQDTFPVWNATPILGLDVYEHSYIRDFSTARPKYIDAFIANIDWADVSGRWGRIAQAL